MKLVSATRCHMCSPHCVRLTAALAGGRVIVSVVGVKTGYGEK